MQLRNKILKKVEKKSHLPTGYGRMRNSNKCRRIGYCGHPSMTVPESVAYAAFFYGGRGEEEGYREYNKNIFIQLFFSY